MEPRITVITLGVEDLERALRFYHDGLGFPTDGIIGTEFEGGAVVFCKMAGGLLFALYAKTSIANDTHLTLTSQPAHQVTIGHNVRARDEVDQVMREAEAAGARIVDPARDRVWGGYSGHFEDPDGHIWEIVWNPHLIPD